MNLLCIFLALMPSLTLLEVPQFSLNMLSSFRSKGWEAWKFPKSFHVRCQKKYSKISTTLIKPDSDRKQRSILLLHVFCYNWHGLNLSHFKFNFDDQLGNEAKSSSSTSSFLPIPPRKRLSPTWSRIMFSRLIEIRFFCHFFLWQPPKFCLDLTSCVA